MHRTAVRPGTTHIVNQPATGLMGLEPTTSAVTVRRSNQAELQPLMRLTTPSDSERATRFELATFTLAT